MKYRAIANFDGVIMFELQRRLQEGKARPEMSFGEIVRACAKAGRNFIIPKTPEKNKAAFYADMFQQIEMLSQSEWIIIHNDHSGKLSSVTLTDRGIEYLKEVVFSNQRVMGS
ncbi:MAG: hypothetical protein AB1600_03325 [Bacteroidota bacterium]